MTLVNTTGSASFPTLPRGASGAPSSSVDSLNAQDEAVAGVYQSPISDTITKVGFRLNAITGACDLDVRIETLDASGRPSGTLWDTNTNYTLSLAGTEDNTWIEVTLTSGAAVSRGDIFAVVLNHSSADTNTIQVQYAFQDVNIQGLPYTLRRPSGTWAATLNSPMFSLYFSSAGYNPLNEIYPMTAINSTLFSGASTPDHIGNKITPNFKCVVEGCWIWADLDNDATVQLLDSDGSTVLASVTLDADIPSYTGQAINIQYFSSDVTLTAGTSYYLIVKEPSGNISIYDYEFDSAAVKAQYIDTQVISVTAKDPTDYTDYTEDSTKIVQLGLMLKQIDDGAAGGGGGNSNLLAGKL